MKNYSAKTYFQYKEDIIIDRGHELDTYLKHVITVANTFPRDQLAIGSLDINDLIQAGNIGLVEAWKKVDWNRIDNSPNPQGELWSFLKKRIKWSIRREIDKHAQHIAVPINMQENTRNNLGNLYLDKVLVNIFPRFFDDTKPMPWDDGSSWLSIRLEEIIIDYLQTIEKNIDNIDILLHFYGIGFDKLSMKELAKKYDRKENAIGQTIYKMKKKLDNQDFRRIIENFYENW